MYISYSNGIHSINEDNIAIYKRTKIGFSGFYCKKCFKPIIVRMSIDNSFECDDNVLFTIENSYSFKCPECGSNNKFNYELDPNITPTITLLNKKGYKTKFCCEGHVSEDGSGTAYIYFDKSVDPSLIVNYPLPYPWYRDSDIQKNYDLSKVLIIRCSEQFPLKQRMDAIYKWVESLPEVKNDKDEDLLVSKDE